MYFSKEPQEEKNQDDKNQDDKNQDDKNQVHTIIYDNCDIQNTSKIVNKLSSKIVNKQ